MKANRAIRQLVRMPHPNGAFFAALGRVYKRSRESALHLLKGPLAIIRATLKEIFEESAYARFLERRGLTSSREAYAIFLRETEVTRVRRPRCC